jgi:hypothetical protein
MQKSYGITQTHSKVLSPPAILQTRSSEPLYSTQPYYIPPITPVTPRPRINFSWQTGVSSEKNLDQTVKKTPEESITPREQEP